MDKQEYREFLDEIKRSYNAKNYEQVAAYADELDFGKLKDVRTLEMISDSYDQLGETDNAIDALAAAYSRNKSSKQTAYRLGELCLKANDLDGAVDYYNDYCKLSNNNIKGLLLKYEIGKAGGLPTGELIKVLEKYNAREKDEKWEYELARLYHEAGQVQKCVETCDNICLWYSDGEYVKKALELKFSHTALSPEQQVQYEHMMQEYMDPDERTILPEPEEDEVARTLAEEYFAETDKPSAEKRVNEAMTETARMDALQDTRVIPVNEIMEEIESEAAGTARETDVQAEIAPEEENDITAEAALEAGEAETDNKADEVALEERPSNRITFEELRAMIQNGNSKKAQKGVFFTYSEPTEEDIAEEEAMKAARAEARRKAEEEAARKAAEEEAAREAALAAAREAARLEEEARVEAALRKAAQAELEEKLQKESQARADVVSGHEEPSAAEDPDSELEETKFIDRNELIARLSAEDGESNEAPEEAAPSAPEATPQDVADEQESLGFTAMLDVIAAEVGLEEVTAQPEIVETKEDDEVGATMIFSRDEIDAAINEKEEPYQTPEQKLGAAIEQIIDDANATVERDMEETKNIRIVLPVASANKLGVTSVKLSQYASSVVKPALSSETPDENVPQAGAPRIIDNVDFSYIPISADEDGQLGLNIEYLTFNDKDEVEGQLSIEDVMKNYSRKLNSNKARVLDIESERLRQIQEAVNLTSPVKLPYSMDDLMFDDIELSDIEGNIEEKEGDIFRFDPDSIGVIPSDEELMAASEAEAAEDEKTEELKVEELAALEVEVEEPAEPEPEAEELKADESEVLQGIGEVTAMPVFSLFEETEDIAEAEEPEETEDIAEAEETEEAEDVAEAEEAEEAEDIAEIEEAEEMEAGSEPEAEPDEVLTEAEIAISQFESAEPEEIIETEPEEIRFEEELDDLADLIITETEAEAEAETEPEAGEIEAEPEAAVEVELEPEAESEPEPEPEAEEEMTEAEMAIAQFEAEAANEAEDVEDEDIPFDDDLDGLAELIISEAEAETEKMTEAQRAIEAFDEMAAEQEFSESEEDEIGNEFYDVLAQLSQPEEAESAAKEDADTEKLLETDAFEEVFTELMSEEEEPQEPEADIPEELAEEDPGDTALPKQEEPAEEEITVAAEKPVITSEDGYMLPDDMRESMSEFLFIDGMEQEIVNVVSGIVRRKRAGNASAGNLVVTGDIKSGKTFLAIEIIKAVTEELGANNGKVAKVQAELLNGKNIEKVFEKIDGSDLIIENIGFLDDTTIEDLTAVMSSGRFSSMVIVEGNQLAIESIFVNFPEFEALFENRIDINELSIVQWADIAMQYADEKGFVLDDMAKLALHARINEINIPTTRLGYDQILDIMDDAIAKAEKRGSGKLFAAFKKNEDDKREMIESDFL